MSSKALVRCFSKGGIAAGLMAGATTALALALPQQAQAFRLYNGPQYGNNILINLATTVSWTPIWRTNNPSSVLTSAANANGSEGDIDFSHGLVNDLFEILPILDITDGNYGAHFSGEAYLDTSYLGTNQNDQPNTLNPISVSKHTDFTSATRNVEGLNARLLDAFVGGRQYFGPDESQSLTLQAGRQTLLWGQSFLLLRNGIAAGMAPIDVIKAQNTPNAQIQQVAEPVGQLVASYQPNNFVTIQGYYQFEWAPDYSQGVGAFFSATDLLDKGGQRLLLGSPLNDAPRGKDLRPHGQDGQFGGSVQLTPNGFALGFFALRYDSKTPAIYLSPFSTAAPSSYYLVYPRDIWIEAASFSTILGATQLAGEISFRQHMNLDGGLGMSLPDNPGNANSNPLYPAGNMVAGQASISYISPALRFLPDGFIFLGEGGFNHLLAITANKDQLAPGRSPTAIIAAATLTPQVLDAFPYLNLTFPIGFNYNIYGRSAIFANENHGTGSFNVGATATYRVTWSASLTFNGFLGAPNIVLNNLADRNNIELELQHSF